MKFRDWLKSAVRRTADRVVDATAGLETVRNTVDFIDRVRNREARITEAMLTNAVVHARNVRAANVSCRDGYIALDLTLEDDSDASFQVTPQSARFANGGVKEVTFHVHPSNQAPTEAIGAIAACIARVTWPVAFSGDRRSLGEAIVDREGSDLLRTDLMTVPAMRAFASGNTRSMMLDMLDIERISVEPGRLIVQLRFANLGFG